MKLLFNHLPKNGGMSIHHYFADCLGERYANLNVVPPFQIKGHASGEDVRDAVDGKICVGCHVVNPQDDVAAMLRREFISFAILRDPVSRFVSWVNYMRYTRDSDAGPRWPSGENELLLGKIAEKDTVFTCMSSQGNHLQFEKFDYNIPPRDMAKVWGRLKQNVVLLGALERMDLFYEALQEIFATAYGGAYPLTLPAPVKASNVSDKKDTELGRDHVNRLLANMAFDAALHQRILSLGVWINRPLLERMRTMEPPV